MKLIFFLSIFTFSSLSMAQQNRPNQSSIGQMCGFSFHQAGHPSIQKVPSLNTQCHGYNPKQSCPTGFNRHWFSMRAYHADAIADTIYTCVRASKRNSPRGTNGQWCGFKPAGPGIKGPAIPCKGRMPGPNNCPRGMDSLHFQFVYYHAQPSAGGIWTCVQRDRNVRRHRKVQGEWCGFRTSTYGNRASSIQGLNIPCRRRHLTDNIGQSGECPRNFKKISFALVAWGDDSSSDWMHSCIRE